MRQIWVWILVGVIVLGAVAYGAVKYMEYRNREVQVSFIPTEAPEVEISFRYPERDGIENVGRSMIDEAVWGQIDSDVFLRSRSEPDEFYHILQVFSGQSPVETARRLKKTLVDHWPSGVTSVSFVRILSVSGRTDYEFEVVTQYVCETVRVMGFPGLDRISLVLMSSVSLSNYSWEDSAAKEFGAARERILATLSVRRHGRDVMAGFAKCLTATGVKVYMAPDNDDVVRQGEMFGDGGRYLSVVPCEMRYPDYCRCCGMPFPDGDGLYYCGDGAVFRRMPVWEVGGERLEGVQNISDLIGFSGCPWPPAEVAGSN